MNRERAKELLPIIQAYADGADVQILRVDGTWSTFGQYTGEPDPDWSDGCRYRIKPEAREFYIAVLQKGHKKEYEVTPGPSDIIMTPGDPSLCDVIHVREVLDD